MSKKQNLEILYTCKSKSQKKEKPKNTTDYVQQTKQKNVRPTSKQGCKDSIQQLKIWSK